MLCVCAYAVSRGAVEICFCWLWKVGLLAYFGAALPANKSGRCLLFPVFYRFFTGDSTDKKVPIGRCAPGIIQCRCSAARGPPGADASRPSAAPLPRGCRILINAVPNLPSPPSPSFASFYNRFENIFCFFYPFIFPFFSFDSV